MNLEINLKRKREDSKAPLAKRTKTDTKNTEWPKILIETIQIKQRPNKRILVGEEESQIRNKSLRLDVTVSNSLPEQGVEEEEKENKLINLN